MIKVEDAVMLALAHNRRPNMVRQSGIGTNRLAFEDTSSDVKVALKQRPQKGSLGVGEESKEDTHTVTKDTTNKSKAVLNKRAEEESTSTLPTSPLKKLKMKAT